MFSIEIRIYLINEGLIDPHPPFWDLRFFPPRNERLLGRDAPHPPF